MTGVVHALSASITSALAVKPSTVYVLRVENTTTRDVWHLRRCFSEFCDLRERMLVLLDGDTISNNISSGTGSAQNSPTTLPLTARRLLALNPSLRAGGSGSTPGSFATDSPRSMGSPAGSGPMHERFPYLYARFPRRQFFGSRSKKVIEQRTLALNQFLQEALWLLREVKTHYHIAKYFSLMTQLEVFLDCARHSAKAAAAMPPTGVCPPFYVASPQTDRHRTGTLVVPLSTSSTRSPEVDCDAKHAADRARAAAERGFWHALPTNGHSDKDDESDEEADDYEERKILKKTISCFLHHEVRERRASNPASQFAAAMQSRVSERDAVVVSATDAWATRIEIAGIPPAEALRRRNSKNQAMLVKQYSSPMLSSGKANAMMTSRLGVKDGSHQVRQGCRP
jgi:hypothetical protein